MGRFRPIRICSNVIKLLECHLIEKLMDWGRSHLQEQFGFLNGVGCEAARLAVFRKMVQLENNSTPFYVLQIDLSSAYNTVNLYILKQLIEIADF